MCNSCASCIRVLMIIFNIIFTVIGIVVLAAGLYFYFSTFGLQGSENHNVLAYAYIGTACMGALSVILGILGCCGSYHYSRCLLGTYFFLLLILFAAEIAIGVAGFVYQDDTRSLIDSTLKEGVDDLKANPGSLKLMDTVHILFDCCGYHGITDFGLHPPLSCCPSKDCSLLGQFLVKGCSKRVSEIMHNYIILCVAVIVIAFIELFGLVFAMTLCCAVSGREPVGYYSAVRTTG